MKKISKPIIACIVGCLIILPSCDKSQKEPTYKLDADPKTLIFPAETDEVKTVSVTADNVEWGIQKNNEEDTWLHLEKKDGSVLVTADNNHNTEEREARFKITSSSDSVNPVEVTVTQLAKDKEYRLAADPLALTFEAEESGIKTISVTSLNVDWNIAGGEEYLWMHFEKSGDNILVSVDKNISVEHREGKFTITSDIPSVAPIEITVTQTANENMDIVLTAIAGYRQDYYENGGSNFIMSLYTTEINEWGMPLGTGYQIEFDFFSELPLSEANPDVAAGTYTIENSYKKYTAIPGEYFNDEYWGYEGYNFSAVSYFADGMLTEQKGISSGTFIVEKSGSEYTITADLILSDETPLTAYFNGELPVASPFLTTLTEDTHVADMIGARVNFYGDYYDAGSYYWYIEMWGEGIEFDGSLVGNGDYFTLNFFSAREGDGVYIPTGNYELLPDTKAAGTAIPGFAGFVYDGCWYMEMADNFPSGRHAPLSSEYIKVSRQDDKYIIEIDARDDAGNKITCKYEGELNINNHAAGAQQLPYYKYTGPGRP